MTFRVLFVCTGNICRSAMAEVVLNQHFEAAGLDAVATSVGISDEEHGNPIDYRAQRTLKAAGYDIPNHFARQITAQDLKDCDLVLAMTSNHYAAVERLAAHTHIDVIENPQVGDERSTDLRMFRAMDPALAGARRRELDVPDPWYGTQQDFEDTLDVIESVADYIVEHAREASETSA